ncbi:MAG: Transposase [Citrobacter braakii]
MQAELQTALFQAFDTLNLQRVKRLAFHRLRCVDWERSVPADRKHKRAA